MTTKADQARLDWIHTLPCICCVIERENSGVMLDQPFRTTAHHIVDKGYRKHSGGHQSTLPLCEWHHQGRRLVSLNSAEMTDIYGPSLAVSKREFSVRYGGERALLARVDA